jgi:RNA polymerase sigma factor (sigma-70 family)
MIDEEIIKAICSTAHEQNKALEQIYRYKGAEFKRFFNFNGIPLGSCEDVLQDAILKIFNGAKDFRGSGGFSENSANAWMWAVARNCMYDYLKREKPSTSSHEKDEPFSQVKRDQALSAGIFDGEKTVFPYVETRHQSSKAIGGSLNDSDWMEKHSKEINDSEFTLVNDATIRKNQLEIDLCVSNGIEEFCAKHPDRALVLMMQMDGESIESIARRIERTSAATKEYISQCKIRLKPFIEHCLAFVTG